MKKKIILIIIVLLIIIISMICIILLKREKAKYEIERKYYIENGAIYEKTEDIDKNAIESNIAKINIIYEKHLNNMKTYFSIIPDKEYYLKDRINTKFSELENKVKTELNEKVKYINITDTLELDDFYRTDMHWKQENLDETVNKIEKNLGIDRKENIKYEEKSLGEFYGTYYKEIKNKELKADKLRYLNNSVLENCKVYNEETKKEEKIYNLDRVKETKNKYDLFLSGATAISTITNENIKTNRKLILFRDSFGSSIAPLFANNYKQIVLVDIRYINYQILEKYLNFDNYENQDVLFLYSSRVINKSGIFR